MQKTTFSLAVALTLSALSWAQDVKINGTGVSLEANKTPVHTARDPQATVLLPKDLHLAAPGKFTVAAVALNSPPLTVFTDDNKTLFGSETDVVQPAAEGLGLEMNVAPTSWEDWSLGTTSGRYGAMISNITVIKERKEKFDFVTYHKDSLGFYVRSTGPLNRTDKTEDIVELETVAGSGTNQEAVLLAWSAENVKRGLKPFTPVYIKDDTAQTLALQTGRADVYSGPNMIDAWKAAPAGKTKLVGSVDGGWPKAAHITVTLKKDSGPVNTVQTALNDAIISGDCARVLNRWGRGVESTP